MNYNKEELNHLIRHRRSVFPDQYSGEVIDDEIINQLLENANWAPNHGRTEPWRFFVFKGESLKKLGELQAELYKELTPEESYQEVKFNKLLNNPQKASHVIAICMKRQQSQKIPEIEEIEATACAVQNIYLTATAYGIGGYWSSGGVTYKEQLKEYFGLGEKDKVLGFFYLGYPKETPPDSKRGAIEEKVTWV
ncbi:MAG: nitroreductase family protein [Flammeovirgaceae bacterium]